jgi:bla regulator protein BlaR1
VWLAERRFRQQLHEALPVNDPRALERWSACLRHTAHRRVHTLWQVEGIRSPLLYGGVRPRLLLPATLVGQLSDGELEHVFCHELTHDLRRDIWANWMATALSLVHWFNPLVWWGLARCTAIPWSGCSS